MGLGRVKQKENSGNLVLIRRILGMDNTNAKLLIRYDAQKKRLSVAYFLLLLGGVLGLHWFYLSIRGQGFLRLAVAAFGVSCVLLLENGNFFESFLESILIGAAGAF